MRQPTLQRVLVAPLVLLVLALGAVIYWSLHRSAETAGREFSETVLLNMVERVNQTIDLHLVGARVAINAVVPEAVSSPSGHGTTTVPLSQDSAAIEERLWIATGFFPKFNDYVYFGGVDGRFIGVNRMPSQIELRLRPAGTGSREIWRMAGPNRRLALMRTDIYDPRLRPWFTKTLAAGRENWSEVYTDFTTLEPVFTLSKPMRGENNQVVGVVSTDLSLTQLTNFFQSLTVSKHGIAYISERSGAIIATSTKEMPYRIENKKLVRLSAQESTSALLRESYRQMQQWQKEGQTFDRPVSRHFDHDGGIVQIGVTRLRDPAGLDWITVVAIPRADFISSVTNVMYESLGIGLIAVALVMVMGFVLLQWVLRDIGKLTRAAENIGMGAPHEPLNISRGDEIGLLAKSFQQMERNLRTDKLTGALNRETLIAQIEFRRRAAPAILPLKFSLLFIDMDGFKPINDNFGHEAGDTVLIETVRRLKAALRGDDDIARFGGDEFVVYLHGINTSELVDIVLKKITALIQTPYEIRPDLLIRVDASIGYACFPTDGGDIDALLKIADVRMFDNKKQHSHR